MRALSRFLRCVLGSILLCLVAGCQERSATEAGYAALLDEDFHAALACFDEARDAVEPNSREYVDLSVARCQALAQERAAWQKLVSICYM